MSNPQILYTPQQQMGYGGFSVPCRVGNWAEDEYLGVLVTASHTKTHADGMLASQRLSSTLGAALAPAELAPAPADGAIRFGDVVMLSAAEGGVLALDTESRMELPYEAFTVTRTQAHSAVACTRTAWTVSCPEGATAPADGLVRIGTPFCLTATGSGKTVYLQSQRYTLHNQNIAHSSGKRKQGLCVVTAPSADTLWTVMVLDPRDIAQMESEGQPVPANTFVSLVHVNTQTALYTGSVTLSNKYGGEFEASAFSDGSTVKAAFGARKGKMLEVGNHWAFTTAEAASS